MPTFMPLTEDTDVMRHYYWYEMGSDWVLTYPGRDDDDTYIYSNIVRQAYRYMSKGFVVGIWESADDFILAVYVRFGTSPVGEIRYHSDGTRDMSYLWGAISLRPVSHDYFTRYLTEYANDLGIR